MNEQSKVQAFLHRFFQIRVPVATGESAGLGIAPIILLLFCWLALTWGRNERVIVPEGLLEGKTPVLFEMVADGTYLNIPDASLIARESSDGNVLMFVEYRDKQYPLQTLPARYDSSERVVRVKLRRGMFVDRVYEQATETVSLGRGGPTARKGVALLTYQFESVETRLVSASILPSPAEVMRSARGLVVDRSLVSNVWSSFWRVLKGFVIALLFVFPLGLCMGTFSRVRCMFAPLMTFAGYTPIPALVPLTMLFAAMLREFVMAVTGVTMTDEMQKVLFLALAFGIYLLPLIVRSLEEVDNVYLQTAYTLGASRAQVMWRVLLGIAMPHIYDAGRLGFGVGWSYIMLVEMVDLGGGGVGSLILNSQRIGPREHIFLILLVIVVLAFITDKIWELFGDWLFPYRRMKR
ncbi:MAG TPA: ABC transporter permease subunit [Candidatus Ozemobacteraceae bacterium]|nr:ABC transporter permease subunit [Candidatus Ozemobacteraceae bacterium]